MKLQGDVFENRKIWLNRREKKKKLKREGKEESGSDHAQKEPTTQGL